MLLLENTNKWRSKIGLHHQLIKKKTHHPNWLDGVENSPNQGELMQEHHGPLDLGSREFSRVLFVYLLVFISSPFLYFRSLDLIFVVRGYFEMMGFPKHTSCS